MSLALLAAFGSCRPAREASKEAAQTLEETLHVRDNAALIAALQNMEAIRRAVEIYRSEYGRFPSGLNGLSDVGADHPALQAALGRYEDLAQIVAAFEGVRFTRVEVSESGYRFVARVKGSDRSVEATPERVGEYTQGERY